MTDQNLSINRGSKWLRTVARILLILWFGFWAFFGIASGISEGGSNLLFHIIFPTLTFALPVLIVWRWEKVGSFVVIALGLVIAIGYPLTFGRRFPPITSIMMELTMALPLLLAGTLLILHRRKIKTPPVASNGV